MGKRMRAFIIPLAAVAAILGFYLLREFNPKPKESSLTGAFLFSRKTVILECLTGSVNFDRMYTH